MTEMPADLTGEFGYMSEADMTVLRNYARALGPPFLNVGCFKGLSCSVFATIGPTTCIDTFAGGDTCPAKDFQETWEANMNAYGVRDNITLYRGDSAVVMTVLGSQPKFYNVIFIDADHRYPYVLNDLRMAKLLVQSGGAVLFDDVAIDRNGEQPVTKAANVVFGKNAWTVEGDKVGVWRAP